MNNQGNYTSGEIEVITVSTADVGEPAFLKALGGKEFPPAEVPGDLCSGRISVSWVLVSELSRPGFEPLRAEVLSPRLFSSRDWRIWGDKQAPSLDEKRNILSDFCRVKPENSSEIRGFIDRRHILPPMEKPEDLESSFAAVYHQLRPVFHKVLLQEEHLTGDELATLRSFVGQKVVYTVDAGDPRQARPVDLISFRSTFSILCQFALDIYACGIDAGRALSPARQCEICGELIPPEKRSSAKTCSIACSNKLKEQNRREKYKKDDQYRRRRIETAKQSRKRRGTNCF